MGYDVFEGVDNLGEEFSFRAPPGAPTESPEQLASATVNLNNPIPTHGEGIKDQSGNVIWQPKA